MTDPSNLRGGVTAPASMMESAGAKLAAGASDHRHLEATHMNGARPTASGVHLGVVAD